MFKDRKDILGSEENYFHDEPSFFTENNSDLSTDLIFS